jgi:hypothetical protein
MNWLYIIPIGAVVLCIGVLVLDLVGSLRHGR